MLPTQFHVQQLLRIAGDARARLHWYCPCQIPEELATQSTGAVSWHFGGISLARACMTSRPCVLHMLEAFCA